MLVVPKSRSNGPLPADIRQAVQALGIKIDHVNKDELYALCPAHEDRKAKNWSVNEHTGQHKCFACGFGGPFIHLVKYMSGETDEQAREWIRKMGGAESLRRRIKGIDVYTPPEPDPVEEADLALYSRPPRWALREKDVSAESCARYQVLWNHRTNSWVFPFRDPYTNQLRGWQEKNGRFFNNFPQHVVKGDCIFGSHLVHETPVVIVVESPVDAVHFDTYGIPGAVSTMGVNLSEDQFSFLLDLDKEIVWALDNDREGKRMSKQIRERFLGRMKMSFYNYGGLTIKDPGEQPSEQLHFGLQNRVSALRMFG